MKKLSATAALLSVCLSLAVLFGRTVLASDHADPQVLREPFANITDLFCFPDGDRLIIVFDIRRSLTAAGPYPLDPYEYVIHMDLHTPLTFNDASEKARYGGSITASENLKDDVTIRIRLNNDTSVKQKTFDGLKNPDQIQVYTDVRDDPFIFPRFFKKNTIAMVLGIPISSFPAGQQDFILWGSALKDSRQIDHVGRSNRTQQGRFDFLNTLPPNQHVAAIMREMASRGKLTDVLKQNAFTTQLPSLFLYTVNMRKYDLVPDVMVYTTKFPPGFPNGRRLTDDVAGLTCQQGDCVLQEIAFIEGGWPRATVNDKEFKSAFPYLADPWAEAAETAPGNSFAPWVVLRSIVPLMRTSIIPLEEVPWSLIIIAVLLGIVFVVGLVTIVNAPIRWYRNRLTEG